MDERVEIAAKAWWESHGAEPLWDDLLPSDRSVMLADHAAAIAALEAAGFCVGRLEQVGWRRVPPLYESVPVFRKVVSDENSGEPGCTCVTDRGPCPAHDARPAGEVGDATP